MKCLLLFLIWEIVLWTNSIRQSSYSIKWCWYVNINNISRGVPHPFLLLMDLRMWWDETTSFLEKFVLELFYIILKTFEDIKIFIFFKIVHLFTYIFFIYTEVMTFVSIKWLFIIIAELYFRLYICLFYIIGSFIYCKIHITIWINNISYVRF